MGDIAAVQLTAGSAQGAMIGSMGKSAPLDGGDAQASGAAPGAAGDGLFQAVLAERMAGPVARGGWGVQAAAGLIQALPPGLELAGEPSAPLPDGAEGVLIGLHEDVPKDLGNDAPHDASKGVSLAGAGLEDTVQQVLAALPWMPQVGVHGPAGPIDGVDGEAPGSLLPGGTAKSPGKGTVLASLAAGRQALPGDAATQPGSGRANGAGPGMGPAQRIEFDGREGLPVTVALSRGGMDAVTGGEAAPGVLNPPLGAQAVPGVPAPANGHPGLEGLGRLHVPAQAQAGAEPLKVSVESPVLGARFPQELGERVLWLTTRQGQVAEISLNPPQLGPLEVRLSMTGNEAGAQFYSPHAPVREAIESALPRLREMMAEAGITLGQAQVRDEALPRQSGGETQTPGRGDAQGNEAAESAGVNAGLHWQARGSGGLGLVDLYI